ncbi:hypothetical protein JCM11957_08570 [Caminibacter profundus]
MIEIFHHNNFIATFQAENKKYILEYKNFDLNNSISLSLPNTQKFYITEFDFIPYFESFLPEGYLFEIFKNYLTKEYGYIDDFLLFSFLAPNIEGRISYGKIKDFEIEFELDYILENDTNDTFNYLLNVFLQKNAISGIQPKTIAILKDKEKLNIKNYIIKTWGNEFPYLAENEYISLKTLEFAGIKIPNLYLSKNKKFLIVERFDGKDLGFEEVLSLMGKVRVFKYNGSYEQVAKTIYQYLSDPKEMEEFFKLIVMNYLLKNGDAHLKNFGLLFNDDLSEIHLSPAYDVVTTTAYIFKDKPALTLFGRKKWYYEELIEFGRKYCFLDKAKDLYDECIEAKNKGIKLLEEYINNNPHFEIIGKRMLDSWQNKEITDDIIRTWRKN